MFLIGYINGLQSYLHESEARTRTLGSRVVSMPQWRLALHFGMIVLSRARKAHTLMALGKFDEAEEMAISGVDCVKKSVSMAPFPFDRVEPMMAGWDDEAMQRCVSVFLKFPLFGASLAVDSIIITYPTGSPPLPTCFTVHLETLSFFIDIGGIPVTALRVFRDLNT
ncbi:hypothetical protein EX30DRAFT_362190 [Ascodesmis nigricans]|uniref:Uncharacterized protein n=1 Tax=Ascodesmis nigricans TaxID=341454 RepID=A0A4S2N526_9PEZI|nr:hypothetical protein EX30DRAFT_362190 [Ascodesmis nigricans]